MYNIYYILKSKNKSLKSRDAPTVSNINEVFGLIDELSHHEDDSIFICSHSDAGRSRIELNRDNSYLFMIETDATYTKDVDRQELEVLLKDFEVVKGNPELNGFSVEDLY